MKELRRWHLLLIPIPIFGWLLLAALLADESGVRTRSEESDPHEDPARPRRPRSPIRPLGVDLAIAAALWTLLPPAIGWLFGATLLLLRDAGRGQFSPGRRLLNDWNAAHYSCTSSFARNLPLLLPFIGPVIELSLAWAGRPRLGDRLAAVPPTAYDCSGPIF